MQKISLIIVTYNTGSRIKTCVESLIQTNISEIIVVDNKSDRKTVTILKTLVKKYSKIKIVFAKRNFGFVKGCNKGAKMAKGDILIFLNPDTQAIHFDREKLFIFFKNQKDVGAVGFKFYNLNNSLQYSFGRFPTVLRIICDRLPFLNRTFGMQLRNPNLYAKTRKVDWVSGSGFAIKKSVFTKVNGFDENIFMYGEDFDLCFRLQQAGFTNYYFPTMQFLHKDSGTNLKLRKPHKYYSMRKGILYFFKKHHATISHFLFLVLTKLESLVRLVVTNLWHTEKRGQKLWQKYLVLTTKL